MAVEDQLVQQQRVEILAAVAAVVVMAAQAAQLIILDRLEPAV
jgi:hypothetical protein